MVPDAMNAAWGGISEENEISICISAGHKTRYNFEKTGYFTVSIADAKNVVQADYVGIVSGNDVENKVEKAGWTAVKAEHVNAPLFEELPFALECKVKSYIHNRKNRIWHHKCLQLFFYILPYIVPAVYGKYTADEKEHLHTAAVCKFAEQRTVIVGKQHQNNGQRTHCVNPLYSVVGFK
jgi:hypothetical protein